MDDDFKILLDAGLDPNAKQNVQSDLNNIKDLQATIQKLNLSPEAIASLKQSLQKNGINLDVLVNVRPEQVRQAQQVGQQIGQQINEGIKNAVQKGTFETKFKVTGNQNDIIGKVKEQFQQIKELANSTISVKEIMQAGDKSSMLDGFIVQIKQANGLVEELKYSFDKLDNAFVYTNGTINENGIIKQINATENAISSYKQKVAQFKSTNESILSGIDFTQFNNAMQALENGTGSIEAVKTAYRGLGTQAASITQELTGQLNKAGKAVRDIAKGDETIASLKADFNGLSNAPKEVTTQLNGLSTKLTEIKRLETEEGRNANWAKAYKEWREEVDVLTAKLRVLQKEQANATSTQIFNTADLKASKTPYMSKVLNTIDAQMKYVNNMKDHNGWTNVNVTGIERADGLIKKLTVTYTNAEGAVKRFNMERRKMQGTGKAQDGLMQIGDVTIIKTATKAQEEFNAAQEKALQQEQKRQAKQQEKQGNKNDKILGNVDNNTYSTQINDLTTKYKQYGLAVDEVEYKVKELRTALQTMSNADTSIEDRINAEKQFNQILKENKNELKVYSQNQRGIATEYSRLSLANSMEAFLQKNTKVTADVRAEINSYITALRNLDAEMTIVARNEMNSSFQQAENRMRSLHKLGYALSDQIKQAAGSFTQWLSVSSLVMAGVNEIRKIPEAVKTVDSAMIELHKVSNASAQEVNNYFKTASENAKDLGTSISDVINATADWSRMGYSLQDSEELAKVATLYKNVGDNIDIDTATQSLISTLKGFKLEASDAMGIIDKFNEVANNMPIDSAGIGEALQRSAASFYEANTDLSKSIALITASNSVIQDPDSVGTMWKTVSMRIRGATAELEEAGLETEGMVETTSQLRDLIKAMTGFDIMADENTFKDIYDIILGIGEVWDKLSDVEQSSLLEKLAGKRQGNALAATLNNIDLLRESYEIAENSAGSALKEQEAYEQGIEYSLDRLTAAFQEFANTILNADAFKFIVDSGTSALEVITQLIDKLGSVGTLGVIGSAIAGAKGKGLTNVTYHSLRVPYCI